MNQRLNILFSWSGLGREPYTFREGAAVPGSHLCLLRDSEYRGYFHRHILFTVAAAMKDAERIARELVELPNPVPVEVRVIDMNNPTDHMQIAYGLANELRDLDEKQRILDHELYVLLSTGTPQMQTVWVLLQNMGLLKCKLIQTVPKHIADKYNKPLAAESIIDTKALERMFMGL